MPEVGGSGQDSGSTQYLAIAADAGQLAVAPETGEAVIHQLTKVQDEVSKMKRHAQQAAADPRFGGGYAEQVSRFVQDVAAGAAGSAEDVLTRYWEELGELKDAVGKSIGNYQATDANSAHSVSNAGEPS